MDDPSIIAAIMLSDAAREEAKKPSGPMSFVRYPAPDGLDTFTKIIAGFYAVLFLLFVAFIVTCIHNSWH